jgi:hypothetical protein
MSGLPEGGLEFPEIVTRDTYVKRILKSLTFYNQANKHYFLRVSI